MRRIRHRIVRDLLDTAEARARHEAGRPRGTSLRRAVSDAYYALFHALCYLSADGLIGWSSPPEQVSALYRSLDHLETKRRLERSDVQALGPEVKRIGVAFLELLRERHDADYSPERSRHTRSDVLVLIALAREAVDLIEALPAPTYRHLAVLLLARTRRS
ncbi:hypothetical protein [Methylobacterium sp. JK268]